MSLGLTSLYHLSSYRDSAYSQQLYFDQCAATQEFHAADTGHNMPTRHSIQTQGQPVDVLSIDVECHTGIPNYPIWCLGSDRIGKSLPDRPHTPANAQLHDAVMVVVSQTLGWKCTVPTESWIRDLWCANPLRYPLAHSCFFIEVEIVLFQWNIFFISLINIGCTYNPSNFF